MPPAAAADWPAVLDYARHLIERHGPMPRPELWRILVHDGVAPLHGANGFRAALLAAQQRGDFPALPRARTGPAKGSRWSDDRRAAEEERDKTTRVNVYKAHWRGREGEHWSWVADWYLHGTRHRRVLGRIADADPDGITRT